MTTETVKIDINNIKERLDELNREFESKDAMDLLKWSFETFGDKLILASSLGLEDQILTDMAVKINPNANIFFLDTGRIHQETYDLLEESMAKYNIKYKIYFPKAEDMEKFERENGPNAFYKSIDLRHQCCQIRKIEPLTRALQDFNAWVTGLRRQQSVTRTEIKKIEYDEMNNLIKINPLSEWCVIDVTEYIKENNVPYNKLFDKGFTSVGCAPCTRPIKLGEDRRAGRWWWETPEKRECGLHQKH